MDLCISHTYKIPLHQVVVIDRDANIRADCLIKCSKAGIDPQERSRILALILIPKINLDESSLVCEQTQNQ